MRILPRLSLGDESLSTVPRRSRRSETGDTLIEVLIAIVVLGVTSVAILLAFSTSIVGSAEQRNLATMDTALRSAAEEVTSQMQQSPAAFTCPQPFVAFTPQWRNLPANYSASITSVQYWQGNQKPPTDAFTSLPSTLPETALEQGPTCIVNAAQLVTITVTYNGTSANIETVVYDPLAPAPPVSGAATQLVFLTSPSSGIAGSALSPQPVVAIEDSSGNIVSDDLSPVDLSISGASLSSDCLGQEFGGVVTFNNCSITTIGTYNLTASDGTLPTTTSTSFNVTAGAAAQLFITTSPSNSTAGIAFSTQPVVTVEDAYGNIATNDASAVTLAITSGSGTPIACTSNPTNDTLGIATFSGCAVDTAGTYTLTATDGNLTSSPSSSFTVTVGAAAQLAFTTSPSSATGGTAFSTQPIVTVEDAYGNAVTGNTSAVTLAITPGSGTSGAALACTHNPVNASTSTGNATFSGCNVNLAGTDYTLIATDGTFPPVTSNPFSVTVGAAAQLAFTTSPSSGSVYTAFGTQPVVAVEDAGGNTVTTNASAVTLAITSGTGTSGAALACTPNPVDAVAGVATFSGCDISKVGTNYTLKATDSFLSSATSSTFSVTAGVSAKLVFSTSPSSGTGGTAFGTQPVVTVEDAYGNVATSDTSAVTLAIKTGSGTSGATLSCISNPVNAVAGVATFSGCNINTIGTSYMLTATDGSLTSATSSSFNVTVGPAAQLIFSTSPSNGTGGTAFGTQPVVRFEDAGGNTVTSNTSAVTLAITSGTGTSGAALACTHNPVNAVAAVATFSGCNVNLAGTGYTLTATDGTLSPATSNPFNVTVGAAVQLAFTTSPSNGSVYSAFSSQPVVTVEDAGGNAVTTNTSGVTLAITSGTGTSGAALACTPNPVNAVAGVATFSGCDISKVGTGYTLKATDGSLTSSTSSTFNVTAGASSKLVFSTSPGNSTGGVSFATQPVVTVEDAYGNVVTTDTSTVSLAVTSGTGTFGAALGCDSNSVNAVNGVATFSGCDVNTAGTHYTLTATDGVLASSTSGTFNITVGPAYQLAFTTQPSSSTGGTAFATQPVVTVEDAGGNTVTTNTSAVSLAILTNPSNGVLSCTTPVNAVAGVATFSGCNINTAGSGYSLAATDGVLASAASNTFNVTVGSATQLVFTTSPGPSTTATAFGTQPVVTVEDAGGNTVTTSSAAITMAIASGAGTLSTCTATTVNGVATYTSCKITLGTQGSFTLKATSTGLTTATSSSFTVAGSATKLVFTTSPGASTSGTAFGIQPVVSVEDSSGDVVTAGTASTDTIAIAVASGTGTLSTCANVAAVNGVAAFSGCKITLGTQGSFTLKATTSGLTTGTSSSFTVAGSASQLVFNVEPGGAVSGSAFTTQPTIWVEDSSGDLVTTSSAVITLAISTGSTDGTLSSCLSNPLAASGGIASFSGCSITNNGSYTTPYTLKASSSNPFIPVTSSSFSNP